MEKVTNHSVCAHLRGFHTEFTPELESTYKNEITLLNQLKTSVNEEEASFRKNNTAKKELIKKKKILEHVHYSLQDDLHNNTIPFFPWKSHLNYNVLCSQLLFHLSNASGPLLIHDARFGGLGHKTYSIYNSILYALLLKRPLMSKNRWNRLRGSQYEIRLLGQSELVFSLLGVPWEFYFKLRVMCRFDNASHMWKSQRLFRQLHGSDDDEQHTSCVGRPASLQKNSIFRCPFSTAKRPPSGTRAFFLDVL